MSELSLHLRKASVADECLRFEGNQQADVHERLPVTVAAQIVFRRTGREGSVSFLGFCYL